MCDPTTALLGAGMGLSTAGGIVRGQQKQQYSRAQNRAADKAFRKALKHRNEERERQKGWEEEARADWDETVGYFEPGNRTAAATTNADSFMSAYDAMDGAATDTISLAGQQDADSEIQQAIMQRTNQAAQDSRKRIQSLAKLTGMDVTSSDLNRRMQRDADSLRTINNFRRGSLGVSQQEQAIPPKPVDEPDYMLADILSGAGGMFSSAGAMPGGWGYV